MFDRIRHLKAVGAVTGACLLGGALQAESDAIISTAQVKILATHLPAQPAGLGRPITDRAAWDRLGRLAEFTNVVAKAEELAKSPTPPLPDDLYLDYSRTGNRDRCQRVQFARADRLTTLTLAECVENRGRFLPALRETIDAICRERSWTYPAHDGKLDNFHGRRIEPDLRATAVAWELATADGLLGDKLETPVRTEIRENVERRVLRPFREMVEGRQAAAFWLKANHNWNAVCLAGTVGAALAIEPSPEDRAWFVLAAQHYIRNFLSGFTPDGYCSEGVGYWNYGFGHFLMLSETIRESTSGRVDWLTDAAAFQPALFATRSEVLNGIYPTIADCHPGSKPSPLYVRLISERFGLSMPGARSADYVKPAGSLAATMLFSFLPTPLPVVGHPAAAADSPLRTWFNDGGVLICRPAPGSRDAFAVVLKGGHNAEHHNHNDLGSFSVVSGRAMVLCDPGSEVYTRRTFSSRRYDSKVLSSFGHDVPVVAGQLQRPGREAQAAVLRSEFGDSQDTLALDLRSAYAVPGLEKLERTFVYQRRPAASLSVRDAVRFARPERFETALVTWGRWKRLSDEEILITDTGGAVRVRIDTGGQPFKVTAESINEDVPTPAKPVRLGIALRHPVREATVTLTVTPAPEPPKRTENRGQTTESRGQRARAVCDLTSDLRPPTSGF